MTVDRSKWSGEGTFTGRLLDVLQQIEQIALVRVEDAPASRSDASYQLISNEIYVAFQTIMRREAVRRFGFLRLPRAVEEKTLTLAGLEAMLGSSPEIGSADYSDEAMLQYLRTERIVPPYQTRGYKLVELVRVYEVTGRSAVK